jgi:hypothetical protein
MNVEIGTEAAKFPEKECINGIFLAVLGTHFLGTHRPGIVPSYTVNYLAS